MLLTDSTLWKQDINWTYIRRSEDVKQRLIGCQTSKMERFPKVFNGF